MLNSENLNTLNSLSFKQVARLWRMTGHRGDYMKKGGIDALRSQILQSQAAQTDESFATVLKEAFPQGIFVKGQRHNNTASQSTDESAAEASSAATDGHVETQAAIPTAEQDKALALLKTILGGNQTVDANQVRAIVRKELEGIALPVTVQIQNQDGTTRKLEGVHHRRFPQLLRYMQSGCHIWLYGPKGTGKTTAAHNASEALGRDFCSDGITGEEHKILGYMDAHGKYVATNFRKAFEFGGNYLADEIDSWGLPATMALQSALANGFCAFPDGMVKRHDSFQFIGAANTVGYGATFEYAARTRQDGAFLDRLIYLPWEIDETLERTVSGNDRWVTYVQDVRKRIAAKAIKGLDVSPRASIFGARMLAAGCSWEEAQEACLKRGMTDEQWAGVRG